MGKDRKPVDCLIPEFDPFEYQQEMYTEPPTDDELIDRILMSNWIELFIESVAESDDSWLMKMQTFYQHGDELSMGQTLLQRIKDYGRDCAIAQGIIDV